MKRLAFVSLLLATISTFGQVPTPAFRYTSQANPAQANPSQTRTFVFDLSNFQRQDASCEVAVAKASFERPVRLMLTWQSPAPARPSLSLEFSNRSGKEIASVELLARVKIKESAYQLDSVTKEVVLRFTSVDGPRRTWLTREALGLAELSIRKVSYSDGSTWEPKDSHTCSYPITGGSELIMK